MPRKQVFLILSLLALPAYSQLVPGLPVYSADGSETTSWTLPDCQPGLLEDSSDLSAGNLWLGARRMAGVTNRGFQQVLSDAGTPSRNFETRTVTQPDVPVQAAERDIQTTAQGDSVQQYLGHRIRGLGGSKHAAVRIPTKVVFGTLFCVVSTAISASLYGTYLDSEDETGDPWGGLDGVLYGLVVGGAVGFPVGVTLVDPDDSLLWTLLAGVIPAAAGTYLLASEASPATGFLLAWVSPPSAALVASELRRKPSEDHRTSFAIAPTPEGGLSAVAALRFYGALKTGSASGWGLDPSAPGQARRQRG